VQLIGLRCRLLRQTDDIEHCLPAIKENMNEKW
jgi:hypothetical protein